MTPSPPIKNNTHISGFGTDSDFCLKHQVKQYNSQDTPQNKIRVQWPWCHSFSDTSDNTTVSTTSLTRQFNYLFLWVKNHGNATVPGKYLVVVPVKDWGSWQALWPRTQEVFPGTKGFFSQALWVPVPLFRYSWFELQTVCLFSFISPWTLWDVHYLR